MIKDSIIKLLNNNKSKVFFTGDMDEKYIKYIEDTLNLILPESYKWFLKEFGACKINNIKIFGYDKNKILSVVEQTKKYRKNFLSKDYVVIGIFDDTKENIYCLDIKKMKNNECPVVIYNKEIYKVFYTNYNFLEFLYKKLLITFATEKFLYNFIKENYIDALFLGGIEEKDIYSMEKELNVKFPNSYKWFLKNFGQGGIYGINILGSSNGIFTNVIKETKRNRKYYKLKNEYVVIENCDEYVYCLDTNNMANNECPVVFFEKVTGIIEPRNENFLQFLFERILDAKEDYDLYGE